MLPTLSDAVISTSGPQFWLPLLAAVLFAVGALFLKRSAEWSVDIWRTTFISNQATAVAFIPLVAFGGEVESWANIWQPLIVSVLFIVGQVTAFIAVTRGEVSVATPVLGVKVVLVALFSAVLTAKPLPADIWMASVIATSGIVLLNISDRKSAKGGVLLSAGFAFASAAAFGRFDVCVQMWAPLWGTGIFLPLVFLGSAILSMGMLPLFEAPLRTIPGPARWWIGGGSVFIAAQSMAIVCTVSIWGQAAVANVVYSTRGLWGVVLVWLIGPLLGVHDKGLKGRAVAFRLVGACLLLTAIVILIR
jgi:drug/metabolite transporter (DMT)-like permease